MSGPEVVVRAAGAGDLAAVVELERGVATAPHWAAAVYEGLVREGCLLVAMRGGELVGFAAGKVLGDEGEVESVVVREEARRAGVGMRLCLAVMEWARVRGARAVLLEVRAGSVGAIAMYGRLGFVEVGRRAGYYGAPVEDAVLMRCEMGGVPAVLGGGL